LGDFLRRILTGFFMFDPDLGPELPLCLKPVIQCRIKRLAFSFPDRVSPFSYLFRI